MYKAVHCYLIEFSSKQPLITLCSSLLYLYTRVSSIRCKIPGKPDNTLFIWYWKCSGALVTLKGILLKRNFPNGIMKVVKWRVFLLVVSARSCALFSSSLLNIFTSDNCTRVSSTLHGQWMSLTPDFSIKRFEIYTFAPSHPSLALPPYQHTMG